MSRLIEEILVAEDVLETLVRWSDVALPNETGGILLGVLSDERRWITAVREVPSAVRSRSRYEIPSGMTKKRTRPRGTSIGWTPWLPG